MNKGRPSKSDLSSSSVFSVPCVSYSSLEEFDVRSVAKVPLVHGAEAPGEPLVAALNFLPSALSPLRRVLGCFLTAISNDNNITHDDVACKQKHRQRFLTFGTCSWKSILAVFSEAGCVGHVGDAARIGPAGTQRARDQTEIR